MIEARKQLTAKTGHEIVEILDELLAHEDWESSLFLRNIKKRFAELRKEATQLVEQNSPETEEAANAAVVIPPLKNGYRKAYVFLYQADGTNLHLWQKLLKSMSQHSLTRPVYNSEEEIQALVRAKPQPDRLGYAIIAIKEDDVMHPDTPSVDRFDHQLLTLQDGAIKLENVLEFVHANKRRYVYRDHTLQLVDTI